MDIIFFVSYDINPNNEPEDNVPDIGPLRFCPDQWVSDQMPSQKFVEPQQRQHFRVNGEFRRLSEFDVDWVKENCNLTISVLY